MATFNENNARSQVPQFTGASKGGQDTNAFGKLFAGIGDAIGMAAETADTHIQENIKEDVYKAYDQTNQEFGVTDRQVFEVDAGKPQLPGDIQQAGENLRRMNMAVQQGNMSDTHYWARMEAQVRQLRAKYPGYREQIDQMVSGVTGQTPANALRRLLMADMESSRTSAQQEESQFRTYLQSNEQYGPPDMWEGYASGRYDKLTLRQHISNNKQRKETIEVARTNAQVAKEARELNQTDVLDLANRDIGSMVDTMFYNTTTAVAGGQAGMMDLIRQSQDPSSPGGASVSPEEEVAIRQTFANLKVGFESQLNAQMYKPFTEGGTDSYATILSADQINQIKQKAMMQLTTIEQALTSKDFGVLAMKQQELDAKKLQSVVDTVNGPGGDFLMRAQAIGQIAGPEFLTWAVARNPEAASQYDAAVNSLLTDSLVKGTPLSEQIDRLKQSGASDYKVYQQTFKKFTDAILTDKISGQGAEALASAVFNDPSNKLLTGLKTPEDRIAVYNMMTSNAMTAKMQELAKNNPVLWQQYEGWALNGFTYLMTSTAATVQDSVVSNPNVEITFDPKTRQFKQEFVGAAGDIAMTTLGRPFGAFDEGMNAMQTSASAKAIATINEALKRVDGVLKADGLDTGEELAKAFEGMGIDLQAKRQPDFFKGLGQAVMDAVKGPTLDSDAIKRSFDKQKGGSSTGTNPLGRQSSVFNFNEGMSLTLTEEVGDDVLMGYATGDAIESERRALASRVGNLSNPQGSPVVSDRMVGGMGVAQTLNAYPQSPEAVAGLLNFVGGLEAPAGYNQVYGKNRSAPLDQMTVNQVLAFQDDMVKQGSPSSAIGRYQFLRGTLRGLLQEQGLTGSELFTPELQDKLAVALLQRRGLNRFLEGRMSLEKFGDNLASEWAALPLLSGPNRGKSKYAGDGLNNALTTAEMFEETLGSGLFAKRDTDEGTMADWSAIGYANIPENERKDFVYWNDNPIANDSKNLATVDSRLQEIVTKAREIAGVNFVVGSGKRDETQQKRAVELGWSKTMDSKHKKGNAADIWVLDENGQVTFADKAAYKKVATAMKQVAQELGYDLEWGGDWKSFKDIPHFEIKGDLKVASK